MTNQQMRTQVIQAYAGSYRGTPWERKVNKMNDRQVQAIYLQLKGQGKL